MRCSSLGWLRRGPPVESVDEALDEIDVLFDEGFPLKNMGRYGKLIKFIRKSQAPFTAEQQSRIYDNAISLLRKGIHQLADFVHTIDHFADFLLFTGYKANEWLEHAEYVDPENPDMLAIKFELAVKFLREIGILKPGESPEILDYGMVLLGGGQDRVGVILHTQNRLVVVGKDKVGDRADIILYPELEEHDYSPDIMEEYAYYGAMDYIYLESGNEVKISKSLFGPAIDVSKETIRYLHRSPRHLYGPLFFKTRLSDKVRIETGGIVIRTLLEKFKSSERMAERCDRLFGRIQEAIESAKSQQR
ncbi:MAG: hypothetical protein ACE5IO_10100 [Thermoplasmata archaeon]